MMAFFYGIFLFLYELKFMREIVSAIHPVLICWAGSVAIYNVLFRKSFIEWPHWIAVVVFGVAVGITTVTNFEAGIVQNIKAFIFVVLPLVAFYPVCLQAKSDEKRTRIIVKVLLGAAIVVFGASVIAIVLYMLRIGQVISFMGIEEMIGIRLYDPLDENSGLLVYGLYIDTNHAAIYAIIFAMYSILLYRSCKQGLFSKKWENTTGKIFSVLNFIAQVIYFPLANSRGAWLCLGVASAIVVFLICYKLFRWRRIITRVLYSCVVAIVCTLIIILSLLGVRTGASKISLTLQNTINESVEVENVDSMKIDVDNNIVERVESQDQIDRFTKSNIEFGAGRLQIWGEVPELLIKKPVFGTGFGNHQYFAQKYDIGHNKLSQGAALHNSYLDLILSYGVIGFVTLISFFILGVKHVLEAVLRNSSENIYIYLCVAFIVLVIAGEALLLSNIFINTTAMYYIMMIMMGYLMMKEDNLEEIKDNINSHIRKGSNV